MSEGEVVLMAIFIILLGTVVAYAIADTSNGDEDQN